MGEGGWEQARMAERNGGEGGVENLSTAYRIPAGRRGDEKWKIFKVK